MPEITGEDVGGRVDRTPDDTASYDPAALEEKMQGQLDKAFGNDGFDDEVVDDDSDVLDQDVDTDDEDDSQADQQDEESEDADEVVEDEDDDSGDEEIESEAAVKPAKAGKTPTLPDAVVRSLKAYEFTDDEIANNLEALGGKFVEIATNIHSKRKAETAQWAAIGRKAREAGETQQQVQNGPVVDGVPQQLQHINLQKIKEKYGDDELFDEMFGPVNATISKLNEILPQVQQGVESIQQTHRDAATNEVHKFFDAKGMDPYRKVYGGAEQTRTPAQLDKRREVLEQAVLVMEGARVMHQDMTLQQALIVAHDHAASDFREQAVRKGIKREVKKRNRGISLKPSRRGGGSGAKRESNDGQPLSQEQLERKIGGMMRKTFNQ